MCTMDFSDYNKYWIYHPNPHFHSNKQNNKQNVWHFEQILESLETLRFFTERNISILITATWVIFATNTVLVYLFH